MKPVLVGIFAHPDDEAFGPGGTLLKLREDGYDIHLILLTDGEAGTNPDDATDLGAIRLKEWQAVGAYLGASSQTALHYPDGALEEIGQNELDEAIDRALVRIAMSYEQPVELSLMTFEAEGLTGHRDHIVASEAATRLYERLAAHDGVIRGELWQFCLDKTQAPLDGTTYYERRARDDDFITRRVNVRSFLPKKYAMMACHISQVTDAAALKELGDELLATECFHVISNGY